MKRILGLDLGTTSIGWALVDQSQTENEQSQIVKLGVRVIPLTVDEIKNIEQGKPFSINAERTLKRGARRNLQRFKLRRANLIELLKKSEIIKYGDELCETGKNSTFDTLKLRSKAANEKIRLNELARVLLAINKKRGYKSSRKVSGEEGVEIDGMAIAKQLYDDKITPGQYVLNSLSSGKKYIPDFYKSDLRNEFLAIWNNQKKYYSTILNDELFSKLQGKNKSQTWAICQEPFGLKGIKLKGNASEKRMKRYEFRVKALTEKLDFENLAIVLQEINNDINKSSGYLGAISDRSKELYFNNETVGEYLYKQIKINSNTSLKNQVFYRQDYLDEFERIWQKQSEYYSVLTEELKREIRDVVIFYQRKLKSQKGLISFCLFESNEQSYVDKTTGKKKTRIIGRKVIPKSSPLFQEFKIWTNLNNIVFTNAEDQTKIDLSELDDEIRKELFEELNLRGDLKPKDILKVLSKHFNIGKPSQWKCNYEKIEGNKTNEVLFNIYHKIAENEGYGFDWSKKTAYEIKDELKAVFSDLGVNTSILQFNTDVDNFDKQPSYLLWHLLYSAEEGDKVSEEDKLIYGNSNVPLKKKLHNKFGIAPKYTSLLANISFPLDYGSLSSKAIRNILPYLKDGADYSEACNLAGYNHSNSLTKEEHEKRILAEKLSLLKKNSLRNPVVEKILNQMVNVVNQIIDEYGKPDEVRIELARELKKSAKERSAMSKDISSATRRNLDIKKLIKSEFGIPNPTKNDVIRYRLWMELESRGHKDLFTDEYIPKHKLFSKEIDIEHIIPKAMLFDDSFSNKTLAFRDVNLKKADRTAFDFISEEYNNRLDDYESRVESLFKENVISKGKRNKLLMSRKNLSTGFIDRDLRNSQYIAKKAKKMLFEVVRDVVATTGSVTDKLREDWDLINVLKELNFSKYKALGLIETEERKHGKKVEVIKDWTKRNDHRHHAMDALTVAFTSRNHIQYLNNLNAYYRLNGNEKDLEKSKLYALKNSITKVYDYGKGNKKRKFIPPMENFRQESKKHLESIIVSFKSKNKVVTKNINKTKTASKGKINKKVQLTPRGQLHKETIYGRIKHPMSKFTKINKKLTIQQIDDIVNPKVKELLKAHLLKYNSNIQTAFDNKTLKTDPIVYKEFPIKEVLCYEDVFTIKKEISHDLKIDKVIDERVRQVLKDRLKAFNGNAKEAFSNLDENPIYLNKEKEIKIKSVKIKGVNNAEPLHHAKDHKGKFLKDQNSELIPNDFVSTGNNHHIAIYEDGDGNLQEQVVSFYEAVARVNEGLPIIDKNFNEDIGWKLQFTMKQNEMFVFPSSEFDPSEIDLKDEKHLNEVSKHLFRVQKIAKKNYMFRHQYETLVTNDLDFTYKHIRSCNKLKGIIKVRVNHIGKIVHVGEY